MCKDLVNSIIKGIYDTDGDRELIFFIICMRKMFLRILMLEP